MPVYINVILTRKLKLQPTSEQQAVMLATVQQHKMCMDAVLVHGFKNKETSGVELHKATYYPLRKEYPNLPSSLVCASRVRATEILKAIKKQKWKTKQPISKKFPSIRYNLTCCKIEATQVKLTTIIGRIIIPLMPHPFVDFIRLIKTCELQYKPYQNKWYLIVMEEVEPLRQSGNKEVLGIDRGCNHIAVLSNNTFYDSKHLRNVKGKYQYLRKQLQSKGTRSAKRHLRKISGRENRFVRDTNHCISKKIVALPFGIFSLEKLEVKKNKKLGKRFNKLLGNWSYYQLEQFLTYKAILSGKTVVHVDARYTSQKCSQCGHIERTNRNGIEFKCKKCGFQLHSDLNASRNIRNNYITAMGTPCSGRLLVNQPIVVTEGNSATLVTSPTALALGN